MTVVHLINGLQAAGAENQLQELVLAFDRQRFRQVVVTVVDIGPIASELKAAGIEVYSLGARRGSLPLVGMLRLVRLLRRFQPDVLHCWMYLACLMGAIAAPIARVPRLVWGLRAAHATLDDYGRQTRFVIRAAARLSASAHVVAVNSKMARQVHLQLGYSGKRMKIISNGVNAQRFLPDPEAGKDVRRELGLSEGAILIGMVARYDQAKDHPTFIAAAARLYLHCPFVRFMLVGFGVGADNLEISELIQKNGLTHVTYLMGQRRDIPRLTAALDVACLCSWTESFPNTVLEAMSSGVPCVVTDVGEASSIVGETGLVVPARDPARLAQALEVLVTMPGSRRVAMGIKARSRAIDNFTVQKAMKKYEAIYTQIGDDAHSTEEAVAGL